MNEFKLYRRTAFTEMRPYVKGEDLSCISISVVDNPSEDMGMIARNPKNHNDQWYISRKYFEDNFEPVEPVELKATGKSLGNTDTNTTRSNVKDVVFWGNGDTFKLIAKASSEKEGWMKSTKAMYTGGDVVVQVTTQQRNPDGSYSIAEALTILENHYIEEIYADDNKTVISRVIHSLKKY